MICKKCGVERGDQFYSGNKVCKPCFVKRSKEWCKKNPEKRKLAANRWVKKKLPSLLEDQKKRRASLYGKSINVFSGIKFRLKHNKAYRGVRLLIKRSDVFDLLSRFDGVCPLCKKSGRPSIDRIDSDGHYEISNLRVVCLLCNQKGARIERDQKTGRFVSAR